jgi:hypothetical protein
VIRVGDIKLKMFLSLIKHYAVKTYGRNGGIDSRILNLGTRWKQMARFTFRTLKSLGTNLRYTLDKPLVGSYAVPAVV